MRFRVELYLGILLLSMGFVAAGNAEPLPEMPAEPSPEEELFFQEIESVYSASKYDQKVTEAPAKVSIITAQEIKRYGYRTFADLLNSLPGFYITYDRNYNYIGVRGFSAPGDYNTKILFLVDGHRLNENIYDSISINQGFIVDLDLIDRVEVIRGPGSSLYGSSAFFGVVNIITKSGRALQGVEVSASAGSHDSYHGRLSFGKRYTNGLELLLSGTYFTSDGNSSLYYPEYDSPETNNGNANNVDDTDAESLFGKVALKNFNLTGAYAKVDKGVPTGSYEVVFNDSRNRTKDSQAYLDLKYQHAVSSALEVTGRISYNWYWYDGDYVYDYGPPPDIVINKDKADGEWWNAELFATWDVHTKHRLITGAEFRNSEKQTQENYDIYGNYLDLDNDIDSWGVYIQDEFKATDSLSFYLGVRYDDSSEIDGETHPRIAAVYSPIERAVFKANYGSAFRAPNPYELFYEDDGISQKTNPDLDPETIKSFELMGEFLFNDNITLKASFFNNDIDDLIVLVEDPADELLIFDNLGSATAKGVEVELYGRWASGWNTTLSYTYQNAEDDDENWLVNSPKHLAKLNLMFPLFRRELLSGAFEVQYTSEALTVAENKTDDAIVANLIFLSRNLLNGLAVSVGVYNLFDEEYSHPVTDAHLQDTIEQDDRTYRLKIDYIF